ncbi:major facilitator superfamily domain-containing protein [Talaromyces proteolyticus]|uniref:Major facilitator superfamily domain-containing protein n=1 Tax=Talaromyces proteolyticus TaxID=1131652 RepID=A0AAD4KU37_9EURO|nr:major facilitator superfamily domain-containing protein [Talaromyces proteolyticus]KAH8700902.1 major facilitator superfamily domain-containing protein [Talaromyces proteolyticus]
MPCFQSKSLNPGQETSWLTLPQKDQLFLLFLCRVFDFMQIASFQTICYYQLKAIDPSASEITLSWQTGIAIGAFTAAQTCTSVLWGSCADKKWCGRKPVLLIGLSGTGLSCIGLGFTTSFSGTVVFRVIGGLLNGTVGIVRTMMSENIVEKRFQSRAFSLLSLSFNVATFLGPLITGFLSNPMKVTSASRDPASHWLERFPYALPSLASAATMFLLSAVVFLFTKEVWHCGKPRDQALRNLKYLILRLVGRRQPTDYAALIQEVPEDMDSAELEERASAGSGPRMDRAQKSSPVRRSMSIWTFTFIATLGSQAIFDFHMGAFAGLWPLFLSNARASPEDQVSGHAGGLGMSVKSVGLATSISGVIGVIIQIFIYPRVNDIIGTVNSYRTFSSLFLLAYLAFPLLQAIQPAAAMWPAIFLTLLIHVTGRVFVIPATIIVLNNSAPAAHLLGKVHGIGQMASALFRTLGPFFAGYLYQEGLKLESAVFSWWTVAVIAFLGFVAAQFVRNGPVPTAPASVDQERL